MLADLEPAQVLPPEFDCDLRPGLGYFTLGKFVLGSLP